MTILCDAEIKELAAQEGMIDPFVDECVREEDGRKVLSYGLGSYGYDIRLAENQCYVFGMTPKGWNDVKAFDAKRNLNKLDLHEDDSGKYFWMPPHSYVLGVAEEAIKLPRDITVVAVGKSSYARIGILCNITPAEAGWEGHLTLEIANMSPDFNKLYANEGVTQLIFHRGTPCEISYKDRKGKYQGQKKKVVFPKV